MSAHKKNVVVGFTVLGSLAGLVAMLLTFGGSSLRIFGGGNRVTIHFKSDRADGLSEGGPVKYRGKPVGRITKLSLDQDQPDVLIDVEVDNKPTLPGNLQGVIRTSNLVNGSGEISLEVIGGKPEGVLVSGQSLPSKYVGLDLIPPEFANLASSLARTSNEVDRLRMVAHLDDDIQQAGDVLKGFKSRVDNPKYWSDLETSLENFRKTSEKLDRIGTEATETMADARKTIALTQAKIESTTRQLDDRMLQVAKVLESAQSIAAKLDSGKGTAAALLNDPKLYQNLIESTKQLNATVADMKRLVDQWEQEGVTVKLR